LVRSTLALWPVAGRAYIGGDTDEHFLALAEFPICTAISPKVGSIFKTGAFASLSDGMRMLALLEWNLALAYSIA
jgi:hypothetical protein